MRCPKCNCAHARATNTYKVGPYRGVYYTRRRRVCRNCNYAYMTQEVSEDDLKKNPPANNPFIDPPPEKTPDIQEPPPNPFEE